ncbi:MAG: acetyl-CoA carboxylase biotin carboxylase subunit [Candidatus Schekmanbacteria bacterium]|nr:acetyl-CoA carboxylase biotin carboxylase subunit [Candidatus Schekmanbacteria bacterium]
MFKKILIANRGEIAIRVIRGCQELGIKTVAVFSEADRTSLHVGFADEAYCIGPAASRESYLKIDNIIKVAKESGAEAIHPGYGFLSENSLFAKSCAEAGIKFIGPSPDVIEKMGNKIIARKYMSDAGIPVIPGAKGNVSDEDAMSVVKDIGFPVMVKAAAGGGGKGMRIVHSEADMVSALRAARSEANSAFGDSAIYIEKYIENPRHIEIQVLADEHGNSVHLFERECSIQRRHQKIIEETPSPFVDDELRMRMGATALKAVNTVGYTNAGTVEFLVDEKKNFYFLEVNTRLQVEHAITEIVTGIDLVQQQIKIAAGEKLPFEQKDLSQHGSSMECRVYAEDPDTNFLPSPGQINSQRVPAGCGVRLDSFAYSGYTISVHYDPLISKLVVWGKDREEARLRMLRALNEYTITGIKTTIPFLKKILSNENFVKGNTYTNFIEKYIERETGYSEEGTKVALISAVIHAFSKFDSESMFHSADRKDKSPWKMAGKWQMWGSRL